MTLYFDADTRKFVTAPGTRDTVSTLEFKRGDNLAIELYIIRGTTIIELPAGATGRMGFKPIGDHDGPLIAGALSWTQTGTGITTAYYLDLNLSTAELNALLGVGAAPDIPSIQLNFELEYIADGKTTSSNTVLATIHNDILRAEDETPLALPTAEDWLTDRAVLHYAAQSLTLGEKAQAAANLGATSAATVNTLALRDAQGAVFFTHAAGFGRALSASSSGAEAIFGVTVTGTGVSGYSESGAGVYGESESGSGVQGYSFSGPAGNFSTEDGTALVANSDQGSHADFGAGKVIIANNGDTTFTGKITSTGTPTTGINILNRDQNDTRLAANARAATSATSIVSNITPTTIRQITLTPGVYIVRMFFKLEGTVNTGTRHGYACIGGAATVRFLRYRNGGLSAIQQTEASYNLGLAEAVTTAWIEGTIHVTATTDLAMQAAQNTSHADTLSVIASNYLHIIPTPNGTIA